MVTSGYIRIGQVMTLQNRIGLVRRVEVMLGHVGSGYASLV
jgi:hypothetical protein